MRRHGVNYFVRLGDATSQFFNVLIFNGDPNYSISGDAYRFNRKILRWAVDTAFHVFECNHCRNAYENDVAKARRLLTENQRGVY